MEGIKNLNFELSDLIRKFEKESGEAVQVTITSNGEVYIIGDLTKRKGFYNLIIDDKILKKYIVSDDEYQKELEEAKHKKGGLINRYEFDGENIVPNPYIHFNGMYISLKQIEDTIKSTRSEDNAIFSPSGVFLGGNKISGFFPAVYDPEENYPETDRIKIQIGKIIYPLLMDQTISVTKVDESELYSF